MWIRPQPEIDPHGRTKYAVAATSGSEPTSHGNTSCSLRLATVAAAIAITKQPAPTQLRVRDRVGVRIRE